MMVNEPRASVGSKDGSSCADRGWARPRTTAAALVRSPAFNEVIRPRALSLNLASISRNLRAIQTQNHYALDPEPVHRSARDVVEADLIDEHRRDGECSRVDTVGFEDLADHLAVLKEVNAMLLPRTSEDPAICGQGGPGRGRERNSGRGPGLTRDTSQQESSGDTRRPSPSTQKLVRWLNCAKGRDRVNDRWNLPSASNTETRFRRGSRTKARVPAASWATPSSE